MKTAALFLIVFVLWIGFDYVGDTLVRVAVALEAFQGGCQ
jgi:hypothetical protein